MPLRKERKRAAPELHSTDEQLRQLLAHSPAVIYCLKIEDHHVTATVVSANIERLLGVRVEEATHEWWLESLHPHDREHVLNTLNESLSGDGYSIEYRVRHKDGSYHWVEDNNRVVRDGFGEATGSVGVWTDITERKRAEERLREQANIINLAHDAVLIRNLEERIQFWNKGAERLYGWSADEVFGRKVSDLLYHGHCEFRAATQKLMKQGEWTGELRQVRKSGDEIIVAARWTLVRDEKGGPKSVLAINTDVTERKRSEEALGSLRRQYELILRSVGEGIHGIGLDGTIIFENAAAARLLGAQAEDLIGKPAHETIHHSHADGSTYPKGECPIYQTLHDGIVRHRSSEFFWRSDKTCFPVDYVTAPLRDEHGEIAGGVVTFRDITDRKEAEEALRRQEKQYRILFETHPNPTWVYDAETFAFLAVNDAAVEHYGYSREEFLEITIRDIRPPEDVPALMETSKVSAANEKGERSRYSGTWRHRKKSGEILFADVYTTNIQFEGRAAHLAIAIDITEKKKAEDAIRESEERMRSVLESALDCVITMDHQGRIVEFNPAAEKTFGYQRDEAIGQVLADLIIPPPLRERHQRGLTHYLSTGEAPMLGKHIELTGMRSDNSEFPVELAITRIGLQEPPMFTGFIRDITERKQAEERLREQADIIDRAHDAIIVRDFKNERIIFWNKGAESLYGWGADEVLGRSMSELNLTDPQQVESLTKTLLATGKYLSETRHVTKDGKQLIVDSRTTLVRNHDDSPRSVLIINTNITEQKKLETQLLRAQRLESIGTLASGVAHDLNNILVPILLAAPILRKDIPKEERLKFLDLVESSAQRGAQIVRQVFTFARGADGDRVLLQPIYLLAEVTKMIEETFSKAIRVHTSHPEDLWLIEGDPTQLHQVLLNLCVNARDSMPEGGNLSLSAENFDVDEHYAAMTPGLKPGPHVLINVIDTGSGIPPHLIDKIFDPFFTTKELGKGTGLGLSTVLGIVKSHGGNVNAYCGVKGTTFRVLLPAAPGALPPAEIEAEADIPNGHGETILLIDDETAIRQVAKAVLSQSGYNVLIADDGPSAVAIFAQRPKEVAIVLTDSEMPIMSGLMLARILRKMNSETKIILSTARDSDFSEAELSNVGVQASLNKPYTRQRLLRTVDRVLHNNS